MSCVLTFSPKSFLSELASYIHVQYGADPLAFSKLLVLLPNRRSCRALQEALLARSERNSLILPNIRPIGDVEEEALLLSQMVGEGWDIPPPISVTEQRMVLARLIQRWQEQQGGTLVGMTFDQAITLAGELTRFLYDVEREQISWQGLKNLVPEHYAMHWQTTLSFLEILSVHWPSILKAKNKTSPVQYRNLLLGKLASEWKENPPEFPVVAAGSTGSIPATRRLLKVIAGLPKGCIILPGLDKKMDAESWQAVDVIHPQYNLKQLLETLGISRQEVDDTPKGQGDDAHFSRQDLISDLMRPAATTHHWVNCNIATYREKLEPVLAGIEMVEAATHHEEASAIAFIMRDALEIPDRKTVLVTHDRALACRVKHLLRQWDITVDDSAGEPLALTPAALFLRMLAEMVDERVSPVSLLALLRHPLFAAGDTPDMVKEYAQLLELSALRGLRPKEGFTGIFLRLARKKDDASIDALKEWLRRIENICQPFIALMAKDRSNIAAILSAHIAAAEALAATATESGALRLWGNEKGVQLNTCLLEILQAAEGIGDIETWSYTHFLQGLLEDKVYRPSYGGHPRLAILSPMEARLLEADSVILGGLNEGSWPPAVSSDPWMNHSMRERFGLPPKTQKIGMAAHDFCQLLSIPHVVLTRAAKVEGKPCIPSRWWLRLRTLLAGAELLDKVNPSKPWLSWVRQWQEPESYITLAPPAPVPPVESRPNILYVTQVEKLLRDPYSIYASHILGLKALDPLDQDINRADFGNALHHILAWFVEHYKDLQEGQELHTLLAYGKKALKVYFEDSPALELFWWSRFERIAAWFVETEQQKRREGVQIISEQEGSLALEIGDKVFQLKARADRIEMDTDGNIRLVDYKTGTVPSAPEVKQGFACQMTLEAVIAEASGFDCLKPEAKERDYRHCEEDISLTKQSTCQHSVLKDGLPRRLQRLAMTTSLQFPQETNEGDNPMVELEYWKLTGGEPAAEPTPVVKDPKQCIIEARQGIMRLLEYFSQSDTAYPSEPWPEYAPRFSDYRHLARIQEWGNTSGGG